MTFNNTLYYNPKLKELAKQLRKSSTLSEVLLWKKIKCRNLGFEFHRQVPINEYIVDFFCHELMLSIEIDGSSHDQKYEYDLSRNTKLEALGITILHFKDNDVKKDMNNVLRAIELKIEELKNIQFEGKTSPGPLRRGIDTTNWE
jgi:very-short-patch-repair endonuclease